jgi:parallel beta-helix repeat protein
MDSGDDWIVRGNFIHDLQKGQGDGVSYAAFMKSGGNRGLFERNLVICAKDFSGGTRIGLSFGGGGTGNQYCQPAFDPNVPCDPEHTGGTMRNNVIVNCSDVGIYLNKSKDTHLLYNTLISTAGIDFRYASSTGEARGNVLSGNIRNREGGSHSASDNLTGVTTFDAMYMAPLQGDLRKKGDLSALLDKGPKLVEGDYCGRTRTGDRHDLGALEHSLGECNTTTPPPVDGGLPQTPPDASVPDGGAPSFVDGGSKDENAATDEGTSGGGCAMGGASAGGGAGLLFAVALLLISRRSR